MIIVRRVIHRSSALFQKALMPRGSGFYDGHSSGSLDAFVSHQKWRRNADNESLQAKKNREHNRYERRLAKLKAEKQYWTSRDLARQLKDPWDDWFDPEKINRTAPNQQVPPSTRFLNSSVDASPPPPPQSPNTATNSKTVPKPGRSNSKAILAGLAAAGLVGAGAYFIRRRKSSKGKQIIERVRR